MSLGEGIMLVMIPTIAVTMIEEDMATADRCTTIVVTATMTVVTIDTGMQHRCERDTTSDTIADEMIETMIDEGTDLVLASISLFWRVLNTEEASDSVSPLLSRLSDLSYTLRLQH